MYKKTTALLLIITITELMLYASKLRAQTSVLDQPNCAYGPSGTELTLFGDSRALGASWINVNGFDY
jgi:hypothetical protein